MIALNPQQTYPVMLDLELARPEGERRATACRFLTAMQFLEIEQLLDDAEQKADGLAVLGEAEALDRPAIKKLRREMVDTLRKAAAIGTVKAEDIDGLTIDELWEFVNKKSNGSRLEERERKKSVLQSDSAAATTSAKPAPGASA